MVSEKDEYLMEQLKCPRCDGRLMDIGTDSPKKVEMVQCRIVRRKNIEKHIDTVSERVHDIITDTVSE